jgi:hypothetical protein
MHAPLVVWLRRVLLLQRLRWLLLWRWRLSISTAWIVCSATFSL